jgi:hypothetical protein
LKTVTSALPKIRIEEIRSFVPGGREPRSSPVLTQK